MISRTYVNGVIAAKEKYFLGEKLLRLCESDAATALRTLKENGFGGDAAEEKGAEELIRAEEASINAFVRSMRRAKRNGNTSLRRSIRTTLRHISKHTF